MCAPACSLGQKWDTLTDSCVTHTLTISGGVWWDTNPTDGNRDPSESAENFEIRASEHLSTAHSTGVRPLTVYFISGMLSNTTIPSAHKTYLSSVYFFLPLSSVAVLPNESFVNFFDTCLGFPRLCLLHVSHDRSRSFFHYCGLFPNHR